jgi:hypothetical protein
MKTDTMQSAAEVALLSSMNFGSLFKIKHPAVNRVFGRSAIACELCPRVFI